LHHPASWLKRRHLIHAIDRFAVSSHILLSAHNQVRVSQGQITVSWISSLLVPKGGRTRTDKIGVGAGGDIGVTDISCNLYGQEVHGADRTKLSGRPPTCRRDAGEPLDKYAGLVRTRRDNFVLSAPFTAWPYRLHVISVPPISPLGPTLILSVCVYTRPGLYWWQQRYRRRHRHRFCRCVYAGPKAVVIIIGHLDCRGELVWSRGPLERTSVSEGVCLQPDIHF
jgi:hypothetical protein